MSNNRVIASILAAMGTPPLLMTLLALVRAEWVVGLLCGIVTWIWFVMAWLFVALDNQKGQPVSEPPPK